MYGYIYKTTNLYNGKIYVGQHKSSKFNPNYYVSGVRFTNVFNKYGKESFVCELLEKCYSEDELNEKEQYWISKLDATNRDIGYNLMSGGYKIRGIKHSKETKLKISRTKTGKHPNRIYTTPSENIRKKISDTLKEYYKTHDNPRKGVHLSDETKEKLRNANLGKKYSEEVRAKHRGKKAWNKGISMSYEAKQHLRDINIGKKQNLSNEARELKRKRWSGKNNPNSGGLTDSVKEKLRKANLGKRWINDGTKNICVNESELQNYLDLGYIRGRLKKS